MPDEKFDPYFKVLNVSFGNVKDFFASAGSMPTRNDYCKVSSNERPDSVDSPPRV